MNARIGKTKSSILRRRAEAIIISGGITPVRTIQEAPWSALRKMIGIASMGGHTTNTTESSAGCQNPDTSNGFAKTVATSTPSRTDTTMVNTKQMIATS